MYNLRVVSCFILGKMRNAAQEAAPDSSEKLLQSGMGEHQYIKFWWGGVQYHEALSLQKVFC